MPVPKQKERESLKHKLFVDLLVAIVSITGTALMTHWLDRNKVTAVAILPPPAADSQRQQLRDIRQLIDKMRNEATAGEIVELRRDAIMFHDEYYDRLSDITQMNSTDDLALFSDELHSELSAYVYQCGKDLTPRSKNWSYCNDIVSDYLSPSLAGLSTALRNRIDSRN